MRVATYDTATHYQDACALRSLYEFTEIDLPGPLTLLDGHVQSISDIRCDLDHRRVQSEAPDKRERFKTMILLVVEVPLEPLQCDAYRFEQINAGPRYRSSAYCPQIG